MLSCSNGATQDIGTPEQPTSPNTWFAHKFPLVAESFGEAIYIEKTDAAEKISGLSEDFMAATLGRRGSPESPVVYIPIERCFYRYAPASGLFEKIEPQGLAAILSSTLRSCATECRSSIDLRPLTFKYARTANLNGVVSRAKALLAEPGFFDSPSIDFLACRNGMLRLSARKLLAFSPEYRRRTKLAVDYLPGEKCPRFIKTVLEPVLQPGDMDLLQRFFGMALLGQNTAQAMLILVGRGGDGKGVCIRVLRGILGASAIASLRTDQLASRFEIGRMHGRTLLYGPDVRSDFLNKK